MKSDMDNPVPLKVECSVGDSSCSGPMVQSATEYGSEAVSVPVAKFVSEDANEAMGDDIPVVDRWRTCQATGASYRPFGRMDSISLAAELLHFIDCPLHTGRCNCAERCFQCLLGRVPGVGDSGVNG